MIAQYDRIRAERAIVELRRHTDLMKRKELQKISDAYIVDNCPHLSNFPIHDQFDLVSQWAADDQACDELLAGEESCPHHKHH